MFHIGPLTVDCSTDMPPHCPCYGESESRVAPLVGSPACTSDNSRLPLELQYWFSLLRKFSSQEISVEIELLHVAILN